MLKIKTAVKNKIKFTDILPWLWLIAGVLVMLAYHLGPGKALVDGDMGGEMILSDLLNKEGDFLLSDNWYHATEVHVFFLQIIFRPLLLIWPDNWHVVRVVGTMLIYAINTAGYLLMMKETGIKKLSVWSAGMLLWPLGMWRLFLGLYGAQYLVYDFFAFYILWLILSLSHRQKSAVKLSAGMRVKNLIKPVILAFLSCAGGVNGVRETMMLFVPICIGIAALFILHIFAYKGRTENLKAFATAFAAELKLLGWIIFATFFNLVGYAYNLLVLMKKYSFQSNTTMVWKENFSLSGFIDSVGDYLGMFGYGGSVKLFSIEGISSAAGIMMAVILIFAVVRLIIHRSRLTLEEELMLASFLGGLVFCSCVFGMMEEMDEARYWLPFMFFAPVLLEAEGDTENWISPRFKYVCAALVSCVVIITSAGTVRTQINNPHEGKLKNIEISQFLDEQGLTQGYTQFWLANTITEQTSGRVTARPLMYYDTFEMMPWSNRIDFATTYPEGQVFFVIDKKSYSGDVYENFVYKYAAPSVVRDDDDWLVMVAADAQTLEDAYNTALANGEVVSQSERIGEN